MHYRLTKIYSDSFAQTALLLLFVFGLGGCTFESKVEWYDHVREGRFELVDQVGQPYLEVFFLNAAQMTQLKTTDPQTVTSTFRAAAINKVESLRASFDSVATFPGQASKRKPASDVVDKFLRGHLVIDFAVPVSFATGNGRHLTDDVFDTLLEATAGRIGLSDEVPTLKERLEERNKDIPDADKQIIIDINFDAGFPFLRRRAS